MQRFRDVARIVSTKGLDGRVMLDCSRVSLFEDLIDSPDSHESGLMLHFVPPQTDCPRLGEIEQIVSIDGNRVVAFISGIDGIEEASDLVGCHCLASEEDVIRRGLSLDGGADGFDLEGIGISEGALVAHDGSDPLVGWTIRDVASGFCGRIESATCPAGQILLEVSDLSGSDEPMLHLIPLAAELVCDVDETACEISMDLPEGIFDL